MCYKSFDHDRPKIFRHAKFGCCFSDHVRAYRSQNFWGGWVGPTPLDGDVDDPIETRPATRVTMPNLVVLGQTYDRTYTEIHLKIIIIIIYLPIKVQ